jgi:hypothetical protein
MNEKEAREIVANFKNKPAYIYDIANFEKAKGYLEAIEKAERIFTVALKGLIECPGHCVHTDDAKEAVAKWEAEK